MASSTKQYTNAETTGCSNGQVCRVFGAVGLPNSSRTAATTTLTGFHAATYCNAFGRVLIGTNALLRNVRGNTTTNPQTQQPPSSDDEMVAYVKRLVATGDYPQLAALGEEHGLETAWQQIETHLRDPARFRRNLDRLLDGIAADLPDRAV